MGFLSGKHIVVTGVASTRSIAYGIAQACYREGASLALTYQNDRLKSRVEDIAKELGNALVFPCDVMYEEQISELFSNINNRWGCCHGLVHAMAFAPREAIAGDFLTGCTRENFRTAHDVSAYSLVAMAREALPLMKNRASSIVTLSYLGSMRAVPNYNTMGLAKASLESAVRYIANSVGCYNVRCNAISPGPIKTLAASGIAGFAKIIKHVEEQSPLRRNVSIHEVGNTAAFFLSDLSSAITGEVTYVDGGYNIGASDLDEPIDGEPAL